MHALSIMSVAFCCTGKNIAEHRSKGKGHQRKNYFLDVGGRFTHSQRQGAQPNPKYLSCMHMGDCVGQAKCA